MYAASANQNIILNSSNLSEFQELMGKESVKKRHHMRNFFPLFCKNIHTSGRWKEEREIDSEESLKTGCKKKIFTRFGNGRSLATYSQICCSFWH
jgi:hypothetical protein